MQTKDLDTLAILKHINYFNNPHQNCGQWNGDSCATGHWCMYFDDEKIKNENKATLSNALPNGTPPKLIYAKMKTLINQGLVDGCACGCRGDFEETDKGRQYLLSKGQVIYR